MNASLTVGLLSPGDMGHVVGQVLGEHGVRVTTCLAGRSERTRSLAAGAGIYDVGSYQALVQEADLILSILVPAQAIHAARQVAQAMVETGSGTVYADCNAISPQTVAAIQRAIVDAGGRCVDGSIIGGPPRTPGATRFYASGPDAAALAALNNFGLDVRVLGEEIGQASALKMCYAALTKGLSALGLELLTAAQALGVGAALDQEFRYSQQALYERLTRSLPGVPTKSRRWVGEMEEIAATFAEIGLTPKILAGAADLYRFVGDSPLAERSPEDPQPPPSLTEILSVLAARLQERVDPSAP